MYPPPPPPPPTHTHTHTHTYHTGTGRLMSGTPLDPRHMSFGISLSDNPYSGTVQVATVSNDKVWFNKCKSLHMYIHSHTLVQVFPEYFTPHPHLSSRSLSPLLSFFPPPSLLPLHSPPPLPSPLSLAPQFVSMYEIGDYIYTFFREEAIETTEKVSYWQVLFTYAKLLTSFPH